MVKSLIDTDDNLNIILSIEFLEKMKKIEKQKSILVKDFTKRYKLI